jgi:hypothetical protein
MTRKGGDGQRWQAEMAGEGAEHRAAREQKAEREEEKWEREALPVHTRGDKAAGIQWVTAIHGGRDLKAAAWHGRIWRWWAGPARFGNFSNIQKQFKLGNSKRMPSIAAKNFKLCMRLDLDILSNFLYWVDFQLPTEFVL